MKLRTQFTILLLFLTMLSIIVLNYTQRLSEEKIYDYLSDQIQDLTKAIQISVEKITAVGNDDSIALDEYIKKMKKKGIHEISILSGDQEVIQSSNPKKIGSKLSVLRDEMVIRATIGESSDQDKKIYDVLVPVIIQNTKFGYIHLSMYLEDLKKISKEMLYKRIFATIFVFTIGIILSFYLSYKYTKPFTNLINASKEIAEGKVPKIEGKFFGELKSLVNSFNQMAIKIKEKREMEENLRKAKEQAILGQLASGIAHEIRNPINFINLSIDHLNSVTSPDERKEILYKIKEEIKRVNKLVLEFLELGKEIKLSQIKIGADIAIEESLKYLSSYIDFKNIEIIKEYSKSVPIINVDIEKIISSFSNIILNSIEAMDYNGILKIKIEENNDNILVVFEDNGKGISKENIGNVFEPFFSTKRQGIGLGLSISKRIIEAHKGRIEVESEEKKGTKVKVILPKSYE